MFKSENSIFFVGNQEAKTESKTDPLLLYKLFPFSVYNASTFYTKMLPPKNSSYTLDGLWVILLVMM